MDGYSSHIGSMDATIGVIVRLYSVKVCTKCGVQKPKSEFHKNSGRLDGLQNKCKACILEYNKTPHAKEIRKASRLRIGFGLTIEQWNVMFQEQEGKCAMCGTSEPRGRGSFHVDHCHKTNVIRKLLCNTCNVKLGHYEDKEFHSMAEKYLAGFKCEASSN